MTPHITQEQMKMIKEIVEWTEVDEKGYPVLRKDAPEKVKNYKIEISRLYNRIC